MNDLQWRQMNNQGLGIVPRGLGFLAVAAAAPIAGPAAPIVAAVGVVGSVIKGLFSLFGGPEKLADPKLQAQGAVVQNISTSIYQNIATGAGMTPAQRAIALNSFQREVTPLLKDPPRLLDYLKKHPGLATAQQIAALASAIANVAGGPPATAAMQPAPVSAPSAPVVSQGFLASQPVALPKMEIPTITGILDSILGLLKPPPTPELKPIPMGPAPAPPAMTQTPTGKGKTAAQIARDLALTKAIQLGQKKLAELLAARQRVANQAAVFGCNPDTQFFDPRSNQCFSLMPCPPDQYFEPAQGTCMVPGAGDDLSSFLDQFGTIGGIPVWLLIVLGVVVITTGGEDGRTVSFRRRK